MTEVQYLQNHSEPYFKLSIKMAQCKYQGRLRRKIAMETNTYPYEGSNSYSRSALDVGPIRVTSAKGRRSYLPGEWLGSEDNSIRVLEDCR